MARVTSSRDRSRGRSSRPVTTSRGRANRQGASNARVSSSTNRPSGGNARVTRNQDSRRPPSAAGTRDNTRPTSPSSTGRSLPPQGGSSGNSPRAQMEAGWARDRGAKAQVARVGRTLQILGRGAARAAGVDRFSQAQNRLNQSARGTRGEGTRVVPPGGGNPGSRPQLPPGRQPAALPPGRQGGALANRPSSALANRPGSVLANRPSGAAANTRITPVQVREVGRLPAANWGEPFNPGGGGSRGGSLATRPRGGAITNNPGGSLANRPSSGGGGGRQLPGSSVRGRLPGGTGGADRVTGGGVRTGRPGANRPALPPAGGSNAGRMAARESSNRAAMNAATERTLRQPRNAVTATETSSRLRPLTQTVGGNLAGAAATVLGETVVKPLGRAAGQWIGRNVLLPMVDRYENATPGTQSARERRQNIVRQGGRQGPPVPERIRQGRPSRQSQGSSRPSGSSSPESRYQGGNDGGGSSYQPPSQGSSAPSRPQRPQNRPSGASSATSAPSAPSGSKSGDSNWQENFNSGRGTSYTNNPLLRNDPYLMGKMKEREAKLPTGPVADGQQYGESLRIRKLKQEDEARRKKK